jgi:hypothetical protein
MMQAFKRLLKNFYDLTFYTRGGYYTWVMAGITVVTAVGGAVAANQQQKKAAKSAETLQNQQLKANSSGVFRPPTMPQYMPFNFGSAQKGAIEQDTLAYQRSDADFKRRHGSIVEAEKLFETSVLKDQKGEHELMPQIQGEFMRAGIAGALDSFGDTGGATTLAPGSAGEASVARNLGVSIMGFQDRNRANRERSLSIAEDLFPRRTFGMSGADYVSHAASDVENRNAWASANYEREFAARQAEAGQQVQINNANTQSQNAYASAKAESDAARTAAIIGAATTALKAGATAYGSQSGTTSVSGAVRPTQARYPGSATWVPVGKYA